MAKAKKKEMEQVQEAPVEVVRPTKDEKGRYTTVDLSMEEIEKQGFKTKAQQIRWLSAQGFSPSAIAKFMGVIYQHVRNTLKQELKRPVKKESKEEGEDAT